MVPYVNYNELDDFCTLEAVCKLFRMEKSELKKKCEQYGIKPERNEVGDWGFTRYNLRRLHNQLYYEDKRVVGGRKGDDPWA